jgi:hypothetical protein
MFRKTLREELANLKDFEARERESYHHGVSIILSPAGAEEYEEVNLETQPPKMQREYFRQEQLLRIDYFDSVIAEYRHLKARAQKYLDALEKKKRIFF